MESLSCSGVLHPGRQPDTRPQDQLGSEQTAVQLTSITTTNLVCSHLWEQCCCVQWLGELK